MVIFRGKDGIRLCADIEGPIDGPAVVFLHGGGQTRDSWQGAQTAIARRGFLSITFDARGHGESDWAADQNYSLNAFACDLQQVVLPLRRPVALVGASLGGLTAMFAIGQTPRFDCSALILVDVVPRLNPAGRAHIIAFMSANLDGFASINEAADAVGTYLPHRPRPNNLSGLQKNLRRRADGRYYWHWDPAFLNKRTDEPQDVERMEENLASFGAPILLLRGASSDVVTEVETAAFLERTPAAEVLAVNRATHMVAGDRNDLFAAAVGEFLLRRIMR